MRKLHLLSLLALLIASTASAQITSADNQQPQAAEQGWQLITSPHPEGIGIPASQPNGTVWLGTNKGVFRSQTLGDSWNQIDGVPGAIPMFFDDRNGFAPLAKAGGGVLVTT